MKKLLLSILGLFAMAATLAGADTIVTRDGSQLKGRILSLTDGQVEMQTAYAGKITIKQSAIASMSTAEPVTVRLNSGTTMAGIVASDGETIEIRNDEGQLTTTVDAIAATWQPGQPDPQVVAMQKQIEESQRKWRYALNVNVSGKAGNSEELSIATDGEAVLESDDDELRFYARYERQESDSRLTSEEVVGGISYERFFANRFGWFARTELEGDEFENIDLRSTTSAGATYRFIKNDRTTLTGRTGIAYRFEALSDGDEVSEPAVDFGLDHEWKFTIFELDSRINTTVDFIPSLEDFEDFQLNQRTVLRIPLGNSKNWNLRAGLRNRYDNVPSGNAEELDTTYFTGLGFTWGD